MKIGSIEYIKEKYMAIALEKFEKLDQHVTKMNAHWIRLKGQYHDDESAWQDMYHAEHIDNTWWWDTLDCMDYLWGSERKHFSGVRGNPRLELDLARKYLNKHWNDNPRCMDKGHKVKNQPGYKALMIIRDVWNNVSGWTSPDFKPEPLVEDTTPFERLFELQ
jgi:hypothetical protein